MEARVPESPPVTAPEFAAALERVIGMPVVPSRAVWERLLPSAPIAGETWWQAMDRLAGAGVRWAIHEGRVFLVD